MSSFRGPRRSSNKEIEAIIAENDLEESFHDLDKNEITFLEIRKLVKTRLSVAHYENWWDELNRKSRCDLYQKIQLDDRANANFVKKGMKWYVEKLTTSNRLKFKLAFGHMALDRNSFVGIMKILLPIMYSSDGFQKEWIDRDDVHRCSMLLRDFGAFVSPPLVITEMAKFLEIFLILVVKTLLFKTLLLAISMTLVSDFSIGPYASHIS
eukprot:Awhi_evm1s7887